MSTAKTTYAPPSSELVDVVDSNNRPLLIMPLDAVHEQRLFHRAVLVVMYNTEGKLYIQRRATTKQVFPGCWDLSATGHVKAGESCYDAALRELHEELGVTAGRLVSLATMHASEMPLNEFVVMYSAGEITQPVRPDPVELDGGMFVDRDEMECLITQFPEMLTPALHACWERRLLFPHI